MVSHSEVTHRRVQDAVLILIVMDNGLSLKAQGGVVAAVFVLILIVMDNGLSPRPRRPRPNLS